MNEVLLADGGDVAQGIGGAILFALFSIVGLALYFLPTIIAVVRKVRNLGSVVVINFFLGWTLIGWVVALSMSMRTVDRSGYPPPAF